MLKKLKSQSGAIELAIIGVGMIWGMLATIFFQQVVNK